MGIIRLTVVLLCFLLLIYYGSIILQVLSDGRALNFRKPFTVGKAMIPFYYFFYLDNSDFDNSKYEIKEEDSNKKENNS